MMALRWFVFCVSPGVFSVLASGLLLLVADRSAPAADDAASIARSDILPGYQRVRLRYSRFHKIFLRATIDGKAGAIVLDTGSPASALNDDTYRFLLPDARHPFPPGLPARKFINGIDCPSAVARNFCANGIDFGALPVCLIPGNFLWWDRLYDGFVDADFLRKCHAIVDCGQQAVYLSTNQAYLIHPRASLVRAGWTAIPMTNVGGTFAVPCTVEGHPFRLLVDTGSSNLALDAHLLHSIGLQWEESTDTHSVIGLSKVEVGYRWLDHLRIGDYIAGSTPIIVQPELGEQFQDESTADAAALPPIQLGIGDYKESKIPVSLQPDAADPAGDKSTPPPAPPPVLGLLGEDFLFTNAAIIDVNDAMLYLKQRTLALNHFRP